MRIATIPITDDGTVCNTGYIVDYKLNSDVSFTRLYPDPVTSPIEIQNLEDDQMYTVRIYRKCCNGGTSNYTETEFTTTITSP